MIYTLRSNSSTLDWGLAGEDRIVQNVLNLIRTKKYEVPFMCGLGIDPDVIDNTHPFIQAKIEEDIIELIGEYEPRAKVLAVKFIDADEGSLVYEVKVEV